MITLGTMHPRAQELLVERALRPLEPAEIAELEALGYVHDGSFEMTAAAIQLAAIQVEAMPAGLADRIERATWAPVIPMRKRAVRAYAGSIAAAACLLLAVGAYLWAGRDKPGSVALSPQQAREQLLAMADVTRLDWKQTPDPAGSHAAGDVVWSPSAQRGYMRFVGLTPNDATKTQYQLWIFDKDRDAAFPVDGGVFDVSSSGEVIVPITAKLRVDQPTLFAVTVEKPGGVVVSKRERIVVTAAPQ
jgi:anti-sigma-K factor RskA